MCFQRLMKLTNIFKTNTMQLMANLFLLAHQLETTFGLQVIDSGLGHSVHGAEETVIVDYALLADDQKATLPSQVQELCF